jgi:hypothetical protein
MKSRMEIISRNDGQIVSKYSSQRLTLGYVYQALSILSALKDIRPLQKITVTFNKGISLGMEMNLTSILQYFTDLLVFSGGELVVAGLSNEEGGI